MSKRTPTDATGFRSLFSPSSSLSYSAFMPPYCFRRRASDSQTCPTPFVNSLAKRHLKSSTRFPFRSIIPIEPPENNRLDCFNAWPVGLRDYCSRERIRSRWTFRPLPLWGRNGLGAPLPAHAQPGRFQHADLLRNGIRHRHPVAVIGATVIVVEVERDRYSQASPPMCAIGSCCAASTAMCRRSRSKAWATNIQRCFSATTLQPAHVI